MSSIGKVLMWPVWLSHQSPRRDPQFHIPREQAQQWIDDGAAESVNRGRGIRLKRDLRLILRGASAQMGQKIIEQAAFGNRYFQALAEGWK